MCLLANTPFRLLQFEAISTRNGVAYPKKQSKYDSLLGEIVAMGIQASRLRTLVKTDAKHLSALQN